MAENEIATKMEQSKELDVSATKAEVPIRVMMKDPKKVEVGEKLVEFNSRKKKEQAQEAKTKENETKLSYGIGAAIAVGMLAFFGYYIYQRGSPGDTNATKVTPVRFVEVQT